MDADVDPRELYEQMFEAASTAHERESAVDIGARDQGLMPIAREQVASDLVPDIWVCR
jgi:hypothetical protein